jgi:putative methyltransferase (TIGR04325 family)
MCEEFSKEFSHANHVQFVDSWESIVGLKESSLVYSNSTMQYISDEVFFRNFNKINLPKYVVFDDFIVTSSKSYWTLQNYYGNFIPYHFRNLSEFNLKLLALGYSVISVEDYRQNLAPGFSYGNEGMPQTIVYELSR